MINDRGRSQHVLCLVHLNKVNFTLMFNFLIFFLLQNCYFRKIFKIAIHFHHLLMKDGLAKTFDTNFHDNLFIGHHNQD